MTDCHHHTALLTFPRPSFMTWASLMFVWICYASRTFTQHPFISTVQCIGDRHNSWLRPYYVWTQHEFNMDESRTYILYVMCTVEIGCLCVDCKVYVRFWLLWFVCTQLIVISFLISLTGNTTKNRSTVVMVISSVLSSVNISCSKS